MMEAAQREEVVALAHGWREKYGYLGEGGVVIVYQGVADAWMNRLRDADRWRPGCIAVDEAGHSWCAFGGDEEQGALMWLSNEMLDE